MTVHVAALEGLLLATVSDPEFLTEAEVAAVKAALAALTPPPPAPPVTEGLRSIRFFVEGDPQPQGSKLPGRGKAGNLYVRDSNDAKLRPWRNAIKEAAEYHRISTVRQVPLAVGLSFTIRSTDSRQYGWHCVSPDLDKLVRAVFDGITDGRLWVDDAQVVKLAAAARFGATPGVHITVRDAGPVYDPKQALAADKQE